MSKRTKGNKKETFGVRLHKDSKDFQLSWNYQVPIEKFYEVTNYLERYRSKPKDV